MFRYKILYKLKILYSDFSATFSDGFLVRSLRTVELFWLTNKS
jgi:hypothetical protein